MAKKLRTMLCSYRKTIEPNGPEGALIIANRKRYTPNRKDKNMSAISGNDLNSSSSDSDSDDTSS